MTRKSASGAADVFEFERFVEKAYPVRRSSTRG
jgi:hypothetical protein